MIKFNFLQLRRFAERPTAKKGAKKIQNEVSQTIAPVVEIKLPEIGQSLRNVNIFVSQSDPILQPDSEYPEWIWAARGPCRALLPSKNTLFPAPTDTDDTEALKKFLRHENRKVIRKNNFTLKGASN